MAGPFGRASGVSRGPVTAPALAIQVFSPFSAGLNARRESVSEVLVAHPDGSRGRGLRRVGFRRESGPGYADVLITIFCEYESEKVPKDGRESTAGDPPLVGIPLTLSPTGHSRGEALGQLSVPSAVGCSRTQDSR